jgi:[ribosomal protein S5]-alanine N-acetyltransferase
MVPDWQPPTLTTSRLILRTIKESDLDGLFAYASNPNVTRYTLFETHQSLDDTRAFLRDRVWPAYAEKHASPLAICFKNRPDRLIGAIGCFWASRPNKTMELGYVIAEEFWGRGIVAEAAKALLDNTFATYHDVVRIQAHCMAENLASARVMQKIGMKFEGTLRQAVFRRGKSWDMLMYSALRHEWAVAETPSESIGSE